MITIMFCVDAEVFFLEREKIALYKGKKILKQNLEIYLIVMENVSNEISISGESLIKDIQDQFSLLYPYLKLELSTSGGNSSSYKQSWARSQKKIKELTSVVTPGIINVNCTKTVAEVEKEFSDRLGLNVELFRKSGNVWNSISLTGNWTLENQNKAGEFISTEMATVRKGA